jgi:adenosine kinase
MGTVGEDFQEYRKWLEEKGIDTSLIRVIPDEYTACCFITTDLKNNQLTGFYSGAMGKAHILSFKDLDYRDIRITIISPNDPAAMVKYCRECKELSIPFIFDPGHQIPRLTPGEIIEGIEGSLCTVVNSYEKEMILSRSGLKEEELLEKTEALIVTKGADGSYIKTRDMMYEIPVVKVNNVLDPTGAGDAFRAGIIKGYLKSLPLPIMGRLASLIGALSVENHGTTEHEFTIEEVKKKYRDSFSEELSI